MLYEQSQYRYLSIAVTLSLAAHAVLLMPWQHGNWLEQGISYQGRPPATLPRLNAVLTHPASNAPAVSVPPPAPDIAQEKAVLAAPPQQNIVRTAPPAGVPLDALYYYAINELDQRPMMRHPPQLNAAPGGANLMVTGSAVLELLIERNGRINAVNVIRTDLPESYMAPLYSAFGALRYNPGVKQQHLVRSRLYIEVAYRDGVFSGMDAGPSSSVPSVLTAIPKDSHQRKVNPSLRD